MYMKNAHFYCLRNGISIEALTAPLSFDAHVQAAMRSLALWLYPQQASQQGLPRDRLIAFMKGYLLEKRFDDEYEAENAATEFIDFLQRTCVGSY